MKTLLAESTDPVLQAQVRKLLSLYSIEQVQAALNFLVSDPKWLSEHRQATSPEQKTIEVLISSQGRALS